MKAPACYVLLALLCSVLAPEYRGYAQSKPARAEAAATLPLPNLVYGTTRYFNQLSFQGGFTIADINNDGVLDLIAAQYGAPNIAISLGDISHPGTFLSPTFVSVQPSYTEHVSVADLNADGFPDIVYADTSHQIAGILFQDPLHPGSFLPSVPLGAPFIQPLVADMNHDGLPDLVLFEGMKATLRPFS